MSIKVEFDTNKFFLKKLNLPTRYYYFKDEENYIKLLSIGEGIFPKDKLQTVIKLKDSTCIFTTESATKVYPSSKEFGINSINITLENSNCEFINDELILFKNAKLIQLLKIKLDEKSTLFYGDILSQGRSFEHFDFSHMCTRNKFYINGDLEYFENFEVRGSEIKDYLKRHQTKNSIFAKIYMKTHENDYFLNTLRQEGFESFSYTKSKQIIIGVMCENNMSKLKQKVKKVWDLYRKSLKKKEFNLGKL
ncbi:MAG: urease accessory protein UreD [Campylobacteraceae bacterium]|nr:urease accessory protein UreD [Campylobacteraceae bacterium]